MKVAVISDIHDNLANLAKCLDWCRQQSISRLICCGDVTNVETIDFLSKNFKGKIELVRGNADNFGDKELLNYKNIHYYGRAGGQLEIDKKNVGLCHEPALADDLLKAGQYDIIFYGHTHKPWREERTGVIMINPGTLGGGFTKATFAVWDSQRNGLELKILETL